MTSPTVIANKNEMTKQSEAVLKVANTALAQAKQALQTQLGNEGAELNWSDVRRLAGLADTLATVRDGVANLAEGNALTPAARRVLTYSTVALPETRVDDGFAAKELASKAREVVLAAMAWRAANTPALQDLMTAQYRKGDAGTSEFAKLSGYEQHQYQQANYELAKNNQEYLRFAQERSL